MGGGNEGSHTIMINDAHIIGVEEGEKNGKERERERETERERDRERESKR